MLLWVSDYSLVEAYANHIQYLLRPAVNVEYWGLLQVQTTPVCQISSVLVIKSVYFCITKYSYQYQM